MSVYEITYTCPYCGATIAKKYVCGSAEQIAFCRACEHYKHFIIGNTCYECLISGAKRCELYEKSPPACVKIAKLLRKGKVVLILNDGATTHLLIGPEPSIKEKYIRDK